MKALKKPEFQAVITWWSNPTHLPPALSKELRQLLKPRPRLAAESEDRFIERCNEIAQEVALKRGLHATAETREELETIAGRARSLMQSLGRMTPAAKWTIAARHSELVHVSAPEVRLSFRFPAKASPVGGKFIGSLWDDLHDLELTARYSASKLSLSKQSKPLERLAKSLIFDVACAFKSIAGKSPPYSKGTWFPAFIAALGSGLDLRCGRALVETVIREIEHPI